MQRLFFSLFLLMVCTLQCTAMSLTIKPLVGSEYQQELVTIGKIVYHADSLFLYDSDRNLVYKEQLSKVQHLDFSLEEDTPTDVEAAGEVHEKVRVFPNPTAETLVVEGLINADGLVRLYNQQGQLMKTAALEEGRSVLNVSDLPVGTYLLFCEGGAFKVIKN